MLPRQDPGLSFGSSLWPQVDISSSAEEDSKSTCLNTHAFPCLSFSTNVVIQMVAWFACVMGGRKS